MGDAEASRPTRPLGQAIRDYLAVADAFDEWVAGELGIGRTDLRCVDILESRGATSAGDLARALGLTTGATTFVLDRLEHAGMIRRRRDRADRRRVLAEITPRAAQRASGLYRPLVERLRMTAGGFTDEELAVVLRFLQSSTAAYQEVADERLAGDGVLPGDPCGMPVGALAGLARTQREVQRSAREVQRAVRAAQQDVKRSAREAQRSVQQAAREAQREIQTALREVVTDRGSGGRDRDAGAPSER